MTVIAKKIPALRFPEFEGEWEIKKVEQVLKRVGKPVTVENDQIYQQIGIRSHGKGLFHKEFVTGEELGGKRVFWVVPDSFIVNIVFAWEQAVAKTTSLEEGMIASHRFPMFQSQEKHPVDLDFILYFFLTKKGKGILEAASPGGAGRNKTLGQKEFERQKIFYPTFPEQQKIAAFLTTIDTRIQQLSRKKALLEQYKKEVMQQIFAQQIRFKDEYGKEFPVWEERRLGEIGSFKTSSVDKKILEGEKIVYLVNYMNVYRHETISNKTKHSLMRVSAKDNQLVGNDLKKGDILFTPSSETPEDIGHSVVIFEDLEDTLYSYHLMRFRPKVELNILYSHYFCNVTPVLRQLTKSATGSTRFTISVESFSKIKIGLPSLPEQQKIAAFLSTIDRQINLASQQLNRMQTFKKGLLQQMFV